ncbi:hypothetical protein D3C84_767210 [compost metagenome]
MAEIGFAGIDPHRQAQGLEEAEQGPQLVIDDQGMAIRAPRRGQQHRYILEGFVMDKIEQVLEQAGVRGPIHRAGGNQQISRLNGLQVILHGSRQRLAMQDPGELGPDLGQFDPTQFDRQLLREPVDQCLEQDQRA